LSSVAILATNKSSKPQSFAAPHFNRNQPLPLPAMKSILAAFTLAITTLREKANAALKDMPPLDQFDNAREIGFALNTLKYARDEVENMLKQVADLEAKLEPEVAAAAKAQIDAQVAAGELVRQADVEAAIAAARREEKDHAATAIAAARQEVATIFARRREIEAEHGVEAAAGLADEALAGEQAAYDAFKAEFGRRVQALAALGVTPQAKPKPFSEIACGIPFGDEGRGQFDARLESIKELVGPAPTAPRQTPGTGQPPAASAAAASGAGAASGAAGSSSAGDEEAPVYGF
jgi:BMFP domain-containing protein YqiC